MEALIKQICPNFPEDRYVVETYSPEVYFHVDLRNRELYVPAKKILHARLDLVSTFMECVNNFAVMDFSDLSKYKWDQITYTTDGGDPGKALKLLEALEIFAVLAVDIETRGLTYEDNKVLSIGFAYSDDNVIIITKKALQSKLVIQQLNYLFKNPNIIFIWHNGKFDTTRLKWLINVDARIDEDTMLMHYTGINEKRGTHGLKDLARFYLQAPAWDDELDRIKKKWCKEHSVKLADFKYDYFEPEILYPYQAHDCVATWRLRQILGPLMRPGSSFIYAKLIEAANVFKQVELNGVYIDIEYLEDLEWDLDNKIVAAEKEIAKTAKDIWNPIQYAKDTGAKSPAHFFNYKSPAQLKWLLSKVTGLKIESTDKDTLDKLFEQVGDKYPVINAIKNMRKLSKYMDTYVQGFREVLCHDNRIHASFNLHGTETGRLSSSEPNMQNIPRDRMIKNLIVAPPGWRLVQFDYSQAELRVLAYLSKDKFLTGVYQRGEDLHDAVATQMFGPEFTKEQRVKAKTINFGIAYGRGPASLVSTFGITMCEAKKLISDWFASMPEVRRYIDNTRNGVYHNECPTTPFGRQRQFAITYDKINHIQNEMVNFAIQSIASDCTMFSLCEIQKWIKSNPLTKDTVRIVSSVHDSIILEVLDSQSIIDAVAAKGVEIMATLPKQLLSDLEVPFKADVETGYKWGELEKWHPTELQ